MALVWAWLLSTVGVVRLIAVAATILASVAGFTGAYLKGRFDCVSSVAHAAALKQIQDQAKELADLKEAMEFGKKLAEVMDEAEKANDETVKTVPPVGAADSCADPGFLRWLSGLR